MIELSAISVVEIVEMTVIAPHYDFYDAKIANSLRKICYVRSFSQDDNEIHTEHGLLPN